MIRGAADVARGLAPARAARAIAPGERIHVIGAAGAGASAAALLAHAAGGAPDGCDPGAPTQYTAALEERNIKVATEHAAAHVNDSRPARLAVTKALTSVHPDHPELVAAREAGIPLEAWQQTVADAAVNQGGRARGGRRHPWQVHLGRLARPPAGPLRAMTRPPSWARSCRRR